MEGLSKCLGTDELSELNYNLVSELKFKTSQICSLSSIGGYAGSYQGGTKPYKISLFKDNSFRPHH